MVQKFKSDLKTHAKIQKLQFENKPWKVLLSVLLVFVIIFYKRLEVSIFEEKPVKTSAKLKWRSEIILSLVGEGT